MTDYTELHAIQTAAAVASLSHRDRLRLSGPDAATYLGRLLTYDVAKMPEGTLSSAFMLDVRGRIQGAMELLRLDSTTFLAEGPAGHGQVIIDLLDRFHFGEAITFEPDPVGALTLQGPDSGLILTKLGLPIPAAGEHVAADWQSRSVRVAARDRGGSGYDLLLDTPQRLLAALQDAGAQLVSAASLDRARILAGIPIWPTELGPHITPLDVVGLRGVSENKGCYPGQEVIERTLALGRPSRRLALVSLDALCEPGPLISDGKSVGELTSVTTDAEGHVHGLALLKRKHAVVDRHLDRDETDVRITRLADTPGVKY